ncbi:unnamed protein product, partial [Protopolystoma xenopodis]
ICRLVSLWFSVAECSKSLPSGALPISSSCIERIHHLLAQLIPRIRPDKFLPLTPQLFVRLSSPFGPGPEFKPLSDSIQSHAREAPDGLLKQPLGASSAVPDPEKIYPQSEAATLRPNFQSILTKVFDYREANI